MTPMQIDLVEQTLTIVDVDDLAGEFYRRAFSSDPSLAALFDGPIAEQHARFAAELCEIVRSIRALDSFTSRARELGARHHGRGVRAAHYRFMGDVLLATMAATLGADWSDERAAAWAAGYDLIAEAMMAGALPADPTRTTAQTTARTC